MKKQIQLTENIEIVLKQTPILLEVRCTPLLARGTIWDFSKCPVAELREIPHDSA